MNHYPRHIGDWIRDTAHLSEVEECIYSRCLDQYYSREKPLPADPASVCRLVRASSKEARKAVETVLNEFFSEQADGWHQKRCDEELQTYRERVEKARENGKKGGRKPGQKPPEENPQRTDPVIPGLAKSNPNGTDELTGIEANHKPVTNSQEGIDKSIPSDGGEHSSPAGLACMAIKNAGMVPVNPSHPDLLALLAEGVTPAALGDLAKELRETHGQKPMSYVLKAMRNRMQSRRATSVPHQPTEKRDAIEAI